MGLKGLFSIWKTKKSKRGKIMLDYSTIEVVTKALDKPTFFTPLMILLIVILIVGLICIAIAYQKYITIFFLGLLIASAILSFSKTYDSFNPTFSLIKMEATGIEMDTDIFPDENSVQYLKKEDEKIYFYTIIYQKSLDDLDEIKDLTENGFKKILFNLEHQKK